MPGLLDYVKGYQDGGGVDFDPFADTTQADMLFKLGISVNPSAMGLLPTYDSTGADLAREAYRLRSDATRGQATGSLLDLTQQSQQQQAGSLFAGHGGISRAMADVRGDVVSGYGQAAQEQYLDLQKDIHGIQTGYERELASAIGDLPEDSWRFRKDYGSPPEWVEDVGGERDPGEAYNPPAGQGSYDGEQREGGDGQYYTWNYEQGTWVPSQVGDVYGRGAHASDIRLKDDINYLFTMDNGVPIYTFKYKWSDDVNIGTMAQDIEDMIPEAVSINSNGYKMVDYSKVFNYG